MTLELDDQVAGFSGRVSVWGQNLATAEEVAIEADRPMPTGSAAKVLVLLAWAELAEAGALDPDARVEVKAEDLRPGSGVLRRCRPGLAPTQADLAYLMVAVSDNTATDLLLSAVGGAAAVNAMIERVGVADAHLTSDTVWVRPPGQFGMASARGLAGVYQVLADHGVSGYPPVATALCLEILAGHQHLNGFARHLPWYPYAADVGLESPVRIWSKGGSYLSVQCEAGLFESDTSRWVLAVMCDEVADLRSGAAGPASILIADISRRVAGCWGR